ncbi:MAG: hypothetical protein HYY44_00990, partial [Deltaproteobacteria bacterium]|nr:hypothetical protein [Deltaproteobacteria bacterium]
MTEARRLDSSGPAALDCMERHRILTQTGEVIPQRCLSNPPPIGRGNKTSLTVSSLFAGAGLMMTALGFYSDFTRRPVPARPLTWINLPLLLISGVVLARYLFDSEKASRITLAGI